MPQRPPEPCERVSFKIASIATGNVGKNWPESNQGALSQPASQLEPGVGRGFLTSLLYQNSIFEQVITSLLYIYALMLLCLGLGLFISLFLVILS